MCGIIGIVARQPVASQEAIARGLSVMRRRGPDDEGLWDSADGTLCLGHRRLAILDLDSRANQPMHSACGRYVIVFNGEIYNFRQLRHALEEEGAAFKTTSDTEVLLALFERHGQDMLLKLRGMFAFAIWDKAARRLFIARDPYGIKPLYFAETTSGVLFASQVKALLVTGLVGREPDPVGQAGFWLLGSVPEPHTWFRGIRSLPAGHFAWIDSGGISTPRCWWDIADAWHSTAGDHMPEQEVATKVRAALLDSVRAHMVSDVPVGVFLSGGIDSGSLAALIQETGAEDLTGVTITYPEYAGSHEDEAPMAASLAARYGIRHHVRTITQAEFEADLPRIFTVMDQPSIDGINTWYAAKAVAEAGLKVVVSGVGGDELFHGYPSFSQIPKLVKAWRVAAWVPGARPLARMVCSIQAQRSGNPRWRLLPELACSIEGGWFLRRGLFAPEELPSLMGTDLAREALRSFDPVRLVREIAGPLPGDSRLALSQIESKAYMRNQLLRDSDWASMDHSVELRTPLVDSWLLRELEPLLGAFSRFPNKRLLAEAPAVPLERAVLERRKTGFGIPVKDWLCQIRPGICEQGMSRGWAREVAASIYT